MNKQRLQKILPMQQIQAKLKQLKQSIRASEIKSLRSSCLFTDQNQNKSVDGRTMYIKPQFKKKMKTTKSPQSTQSMKVKSSSIVTQSKTTVSPKKTIQDILRSYIKSKSQKVEQFLNQNHLKSQKKFQVLNKDRLDVKVKRNKNKNIQLQLVLKRRNLKAKNLGAVLSTINKQDKFNQIKYLFSKNPQKMLLNSIIEEFQLMNEQQMIELQQFLKNIKQEKKDEALQTSIHEKFDFQKKYQQFAFQENLPLDIINKICHQREEGIKFRVNMQMDAFNNLLQQQKISPRSFKNNKQLLQQWEIQQTEKLYKYQEKLKKIQNVTNKIQQKLKKIYSAYKNYKKINLLQFNKQISFESSYLDYSDLQLSTPKQQQNSNFKRKDIVIDVEFQPQQSIVQIQTNVGIISLFVEVLCQYIIETNLNSFIKRMNYPFGVQTFSKLRQIHGYQIIDDDNYKYPLQDY